MLINLMCTCLYISACNRTYYGEVGKSYRLSVKKIQKERPFLCHLSFTASGQEHGDFVEVSIIQYKCITFIIIILYSTYYIFLFKKLLHGVVLFTRSLIYMSLFK